MPGNLCRKHTKPQIRNNGLKWCRKETRWNSSSWRQMRLWARSPVYLCPSEVTWQDRCRNVARESLFPTRPPPNIPQKSTETIKQNYKCNLTASCVYMVPGKALLTEKNVSCHIFYRLAIFLESYKHNLLVNDLAFQSDTVYLYINKNNTRNFNLKNGWVSSKDWCRDTRGKTKFGLLFFERREMLNRKKWCDNLYLNKSHLGDKHRRTNVGWVPVEYQATKSTKSYHVNIY